VDAFSHSRRPAASACASCALRLRRPHLRPPGRTEAIGQTGHYRQTRHDRPDARTFAPSVASLEVSFPSALYSRVARSFVRRRPASGRFPLRRWFALAGFRWNTIQTVPLELADVWGGSFDGVSSHREDATPIVFDLMARVSIGASDPDALATNPAFTSSITASIVPSDCVMHRRVLQRGVPLRQTGHSRPCQAIDPPSFLSSPGGAPGFATLRRFAPADGWPGHFCPSGPTCRFRRSVRPIGFRRVTDRPVGDRSVGDIAWRSTSGLHSHLRSASRSSR
jgi:hypothetical protein